jgi:hypothetical protein
MTEYRAVPPLTHLHLSPKTQLSANGHILTYSAALPAAVGRSCMKKLNADVLATSLTESLANTKLSKGRKWEKERKVQWKGEKRKLSAEELG